MAQLGSGVWRGWGHRGFNPTDRSHQAWVTCWVEKLGLDALTLLTGVTRRGVTCWVEKRALTLLTGVTRHGVTCWVEKLGLDALTLLTGVTRCGVTCWVEK